MIPLLINYDAQGCGQALGIASACGWLCVVEVLFKYGAAGIQIIDYEDTLRSEAENGHLRVIEVFVEMRGQLKSGFRHFRIRPRA